MSYVPAKMDISGFPKPEDTPCEFMTTIVTIQSRDGRFQLVDAKWRKVERSGVLDWELVKMGGD